MCDTVTGVRRSAGGYVTVTGVRRSAGGCVTQ